MDISEFFSEARKRSKLHEERYGQAVFMVLLKERPELAELVREEDIDPYYLTSDDSHRDKWSQFHRWLERHW